MYINKCSIYTVFKTQKLAADTSHGAVVLYLQ